MGVKDILLEFINDSIDELKDKLKVLESGQSDNRLDNAFNDAMYKSEISTLNACKVSFVKNYVTGVPHGMIKSLSDSIVESRKELGELEDMDKDADEVIRQKMGSLNGIINANNRCKVKISELMSQEAKEMESSRKGAN